MRTRTWVVVLLVGASTALSPAVMAQPEPPREPDAVKPAEPERQPVPEDKVEPFPLPDVAPAVTELLDQQYLSDAEKRAIRIKHGIWEDGDLVEVASRARAALLRGAWSDPALDDASAALEVRAEAKLRRGEPRAAIDLLSGADSLRAIRLRAEAWCDLGDTAKASADLDLVGDRLPEVTDADELTEGVRALILRARLQGADVAGNEYRGMIALLARARDEMDRLSWSALLAEAQLLYDKDNYREMGQALEQAVSLNPRCAETWFLMGQVAVDGFDFERADAIAARLDDLAGEPSVYGAIVRAAARLRQQEGGEADAALSPVLAKFPHQRQLLAQSAAAAAGKFDFDEAKRRLDAFDTEAPNSPMAYLAAGKAMASARQYDEAAAYLRVAAERAPNWPEPLIELGLSQLQSGRNAEALTALETAATMDSFNVRAANSLILLREIAGYASLESDHFIVRCKKGQDEIVAAEMLPALERIFTRVTGNGPGGIDHQPANKTVVELYPDHRWFGVRITGLPQLHTIAAATGPVIAMEAPREGPGHFGAYYWARVVQHEYTHTVTLSRTKNRLPHWFTEASAVYLEDSPRDTVTVHLLANAFREDELFDFDTINVMFARPRRPTDRSLAYAQGHWMYQFIIERFGQKAPLDLMDLYATGVRENAAFQQVLGVDRDEFMAQFKEWARAQLEGWGMLPGPGMPDIRELMKEEGGEDEESAAVPKEPTDELIAGWLEKYPDNPFVLNAAIRSRLKAQKNKATAADVELLERYARVRPMDTLPHKLLAALFLSGDADGHGADPARAIEHLEYLDTREQHSNSLAMELARQYAAAGDIDKAALKAERATQVAPYDASTREYAATIALRRKDYAAAERHIKALIALEPDRAVHKQRLEALEKLKAG